MTQASDPHFYLLRDIATWATHGDVKCSTPRVKVTGIGLALLLLPSQLLLSLLIPSQSHTLMVCLTLEHGGSTCNLKPTGTNEVGRLGVQGRTGLNNKFEPSLGYE